MSFFAELKRRNVFRVGLAYIVIAWVLLQVVDFVLDVIGVPNWIIQVLVLLTVIGLPAMLVFAWVFELTLEGIKLESEIDRSQSITFSTGRKLDRIVIVFLAVAVVFLLAQRYVGPVSETSAPVGEETAESAAVETGIPSIAVLPFVDMSPEGDQAYFADGIAEEILNTLVKTNRLKVAGRTSSFQFRDRNEDLRAIAGQLGVEHILEGSLRKAENRVRITAQLVKAEDGFHLWSETYDRELVDIFAVQDEIARAITDALAVHLDLGGGELVRASTANMEAYEKYLAARALLASRTDFTRIRTLLREATELDPEFAPAWATFAQAHALSVYYEPVNVKAALSLAEEMAKRALQYDPGLSMAHSVLGDVYRDRHEWSLAMASYEKALELNPSNIEANEQYAQMLMRVGYLRVALHYSSKATELDPLSWVNLAVHSTLLYLYGDKDEAMEYQQRSFETSGEYRDFQVRNAIFMALSDRDEARAREMSRKLIGSRRMESQSVFFVEHLQEFLDRLDDPNSALEFLRSDSRARFDQGAFSLWQVDLFWAIYLGDLELAASILEEGKALADSIDGGWLFYPAVKPLADNDPDGWKDVFKLSRAVDFWRENGFPERCRPLGEDDFECD